MTLELTVWLLAPQSPPSSPSSSPSSVASVSAVDAVVVTGAVVFRHTTTMTPETDFRPTIGSHRIVAPTHPHPTPIPIRHTLESPSPPRAIDGCRAVTRPARGKRVVVREDGPRANGVTIKRRDWAPKRIRLAAIDARLLPDCEAGQHTTAFDAEQIADAELDSMQCEGSGAAERPSDERSLQLVVRCPPIKGPGRSRSWRPECSTALDVDTDDSSDDAPRGSLALDDHEPPSPLPPPPKRRPCGSVDEIDLFASDSEAGGGSPGGCAPSLKLPPPPSPSQTDDEEEIDVPPDNRFAKYAQYKSPLRARADGMKWWEKPI